MAGLVEVGVRLLDGLDVRDLCELRHRLRLDVDHDATGDVVGDHRPVGGGGDGLEVLDDPSRRRLVVVGRDDEDAVRARLVRLLCEVDRVCGRVRAGAGDDGCPFPDRVERCADQLEPLVV